jgi:hypothetical protein
MEYGSGIAAERERGRWIPTSRARRDESGPLDYLVTFTSPTISGWYVQVIL